MTLYEYDAELDGWNPSTDAVETVRVTDGAGLMTGGADTPANAWFDPVLRLPPGEIYRRQLFRDGATGGGAEIEIGEVSLLNRSGDLDDLLDWGFDGRAFRLYRRATGAAVGDRALILVATIEQLLPVQRAGAGVSESRLVVRIKDPLARFDVPIQPVKFAGTNVGPSGLEGTADDLAGRPKPILYGRAFNVPLAPANTSEGIDQAADGPVAAMDVYDAGVALALDGDDTSIAALVASTPGSGEFRTHLAAGYDKRGSVAEGAITADVSTVAAPLPSGDVVDLDGTDDHWRSDGTLAGAGLVSKALLAGWFRVDGGNGTVRTILAIAGAFDDGKGAIEVALDTSNKLRLRFASATAGAYLLTVTSTSAFAAGATWHHFLCAVDFADGAKCKLYVDGTNETNLSGLTNGTIGALGFSDFHAVGAIRASGTPAAFWHGALGEIVVGWGQWLDAGDAGVRARFETAGGYPDNLGSAGQRPTGTAPLWYLRGGPDAFGQNLGTGGSLVKVGDAAVASTTPYAPAPATPSTVTAVEIIRTIAEARAGLTGEEIDDDSFAAAALEATEDVGIWIGEERSIRQVLDEVAGAAALAYWFAADGRLSVGRFGLPTGAPVVWLDDDDLIEIEEAPVYDQGFGLPAYSVVVRHTKNYTVQRGGDLAGSVSAARRAFLEQEWRTAPPLIDNTVKAKHLLSPELTFETLITNEADATAFGESRLALYGTRRRRFKVRVHETAATRLVDLFSVVGLRRNRFGLAAGQTFRCLGQGQAPRGRWLAFDLWGGVIGPIEAPFLGNRLTIFAPAISLGNQTIVWGGVIDWLQLRTPAAVTSRYTIQAASLGNRLTLFTPASVTRVFTVQAASLGNRLTLFTPAAVTAAYTITAGAPANRLTIRQPAVTATFTIQADALGDRLALLTPAAVTATFTVQAASLGNRLTLFAPAALVYAQTIAAQAPANRLTIFPPVVQSGDVFIAANFLGNRLTIFPPAVAATYTIQAAALGDRLALLTPASVTASYTIQADTLGDRLSLFTPASVAATYAIQAASLGNRLTIFPPTVVPDQLIDGAGLGDVLALRTPASVAATYAIAAASLGNRLTILQPAILTGDAITTEDGDLLTTEDGDVLIVE